MGELGVFWVVCCVGCVENVGVIVWVDFDYR